LQVKNLFTCHRINSNLNKRTDANKNAKQHFHNIDKRNNTNLKEKYPLMQNKKQPWQYHGIINEVSQSYPTPERLLEVAGVVDIHTARELQSIVLEQVCNEVNPPKKTKLYNDILRLLERKWL
jgi:preprotein translocase subunit SecA